MTKEFFYAYVSTHCGEEAAKRWENEVGESANKQKWYEVLDTLRQTIESENVEAGRFVFSDRPFTST